MGMFEQKTNSCGILGVMALEQGWGKLGFNEDIVGGKGIACGGKKFEHGFGSHAPSRIRIFLQKTAVKFTGFCGPLEDADAIKLGGTPDLCFTVETDKKTVLFDSGAVPFGSMKSVSVEIPEGTAFLDLTANYVGTENLGHVAWAEPMVEFADGSKESPTEYPLDAAVLYHQVPFSFVYGGKSSFELFQSNPVRRKEYETEKGKNIDFTWETESLRMTVKVVEYKDFPVTEWHTEFENPSKVRSERLSHVRVFDSHIFGEYSLLRRRGSRNPGGSFNSSYVPVPANESENEWTFGGTGGRPCDDWLPCFDFTSKDKNYRIVVGWAGQWIADVQQAGNSFHAAVGMQDLDSVLEPGEKITQPSIFVTMTEQGGEVAAMNVWRRFVLKHVMMDTPDKAPLAFGHWGGMGEDSQMERLDDLEKHNIPYDVYWIDAGWFAPKSPNEFDPTWYNNVGDWKFYPDSYPNEMCAIGERVHKTGHKFLLWFEPERVVQDREIAKAHPEWMISNGTSSLLLNLGNPDAWNWCRKTIGEIIERNHIDWYREDFNFQPLDYWRKMDAPDRKGMTEIRFTEGLYRFWRDLRESYPGLMIDNCASGGRRNDIELIRYSIPLWYSDMQCNHGYDPDYALVQTEGLAHYLPVFGGGSGNPKTADTYKFRASYCCARSLNYFYSANDPVVEDFPREWLMKNLNEYLSIRECFAGDFYPVCAPEPGTHGLWFQHQYDLPEKGRGVFMLFRPADSGIVKMQIQFRALEPETVYTVTDLDGVLGTLKLSGKELMENGIPVELREKRSSFIICYQKS